MSTSPPPKSWHSSFIAKASGTFGLRILGLGLQFAGSILIARLLGVSGFGVYAYAFTVAAIVGTLLSMGMHQLAVRELPRFIVQGQHDLLRAFLRLTFILTLSAGLVATLVLIWLQFAGHVEMSISWYWLALGAVIHALILSLASVLRGFQRILQSQFMEGVLRQVLFLTAIGALLFLGLRPGPEQVFSLSVLAALPVVGLMLWMLWRSVHALPARAPDSAVTPVPRRAWVLAALPLLIMTFALQMQTNLDILMLGVLAEAADVGRYRAASRGADLMLIANGVALQVLGPMLARALAGDDMQAARAEGQKLITQSVQVSAVLGAAICLVLGIFAGMYMGLFGPEFVPATPVLRVLLVAQMLGILCGPVGVILITMGHERLVLIISLAALGQNLVLHLMLIPAYGIMGAAWATFISVLSYKVALLFFVRRRCGFDPTLLAVLRRRSAP